jgi:hypothetical protein
MGAGASSMSGLEELLQATYVIGRAISAITFPGMYRIYDFHSDKAPPLKNQNNFNFFGQGDSSDDEQEKPVADPSLYSHFFHVKVGEDDIYIENPCKQNEAGWTPLHTCCMSFQMVAPAEHLIDEMVKLNCSLDAQTKQGPGNFNSEWTALHMAAAYGVEPLVARLVQEGADLNSCNSFGYTPLLEACHRGFINIVRMLVEGHADLNFIPEEELSVQSPFVNAPAQGALGEAARCGYQKIVAIILSAGAEKDLVRQRHNTSFLLLTFFFLLYLLTHFCSLLTLQLSSISPRWTQSCALPSPITLAGQLSMRLVSTIASRP